MKSRVKEREQLCSLGGFCRRAEVTTQSHTRQSAGWAAPLHWAQAHADCSMLSSGGYVGIHFPPLGLPTLLLGVLFYLLSVPLVSICPLGKDLLFPSPQAGLSDASVWVLGGGSEFPPELTKREKLHLWLGAERLLVSMLAVSSPSP